jgi:hypothetical protein
MDIYPPLFGLFSILVSPSLDCNDTVYMTGARSIAVLLLGTNVVAHWEIIPAGEGVYATVFAIQLLVARSKLLAGILSTAVFGHVGVGVGVEQLI